MAFGLTIPSVPTDDVVWRDEHDCFDTAAGHPELERLLRRIARQERRHIDFYAAQAEQRLADRGTQRMTRLALRHKVQPAGSNVMPSEETDHLVRHLFGGNEGQLMAERIDRRIHRLPGLDGLELVDAVRRSPCDPASNVLPSVRHPRRQPVAV